MKSNIVIATLIIWSGLALLVAVPDSSADNFYQGKIIRFIVGAPAGGGYDTYTRAIARHMSKHIPGSPSMVVENMDGAGSLVRPITRCL